MKPSKSWSRGKYWGQSVRGRTYSPVDHVALEDPSVVDPPVWDHSSFSKNRERLLDGGIAAKFLAAVLAQPRVKRLLSSEHFSVDGTLIEAWASMKSFKPKGPGGGDDRRDRGRNAAADFKGEKRSNVTHASTTDPDAMLIARGRAWRPSFASSAIARSGWGAGPQPRSDRAI